MLNQAVCDTHRNDSVMKLKVVYGYTGVLCTDDCCVHVVLCLFVRRTCMGMYTGVLCTYCWCMFVHIVLCLFVRRT